MCGSLKVRLESTKIERQMMVEKLSPTASNPQEAVVN